MKRKNRQSLRGSRTSGKAQGLVSRFWYESRQPLTVMVAPHSEAKVMSFRISLLSLWILALFLMILVVAVVSFSAKSATGASIEQILKGQITALNDESGVMSSYLDQLVDITQVATSVMKDLNLSTDTESTVFDFEVKPGDFQDVIMTAGGTPREGEREDIGKITQLIAVLEELVPQMTVFGHTVEAQKRFLSEIPTAWPVLGNRGYVTQLFGPSRDPFTGGWQHHTGVDIAYTRDTPILAAANGVVIKTEYDPRGYGNYVVVRHGYGFHTRYGHLQRINVQKGQQVVQGQQIGLMGSTGRSTGSHVHFEVMLGTEIEDPMRYLSIANPGYARFIRNRN